MPKVKKINCLLLNYCNVWREGFEFFCLIVNYFCRVSVILSLCVCVCVPSPSHTFFFQFFFSLIFFPYLLN